MRVTKWVVLLIVCCVLEIAGLYIAAFLWNIGAGALFIVIAAALSLVGMIVSARALCRLLFG